MVIKLTIQDASRKEGKGSIGNIAQQMLIFLKFHWNIFPLAATLQSRERRRNRGTLKITQLEVKFPSNNGTFVLNSVGEEGGKKQLNQISYCLLSVLCQNDKECHDINKTVTSMDRGRMSHYLWFSCGQRTNKREKNYDQPTDRKKWSKSSQYICVHPRHRTHTNSFSFNGQINWHSWWV